MALTGASASISERKWNIIENPKCGKRYNALKMTDASARPVALKWDDARKVDALGL